MKDKLRIRDLMAKYLDKIEISTRDRGMMKFRYGLLDNEGHTLQETGWKYGGITKERVRQIEAKILDKIKNRHEN